MKIVKIVIVNNVQVARSWEIEKGIVIIGANVLVEAKLGFS